MKEILWKIDTQMKSTSFTLKNLGPLQILGNPFLMLPFDRRRGNTRIFTVGLKASKLDTIIY